MNVHMTRDCADLRVPPKKATRITKNEMKIEVCHRLHSQPHNQQSQVAAAESQQSRAGERHSPECGNTHESPRSDARGNVIAGLTL